MQPGEVAVDFQHPVIVDAREDVRARAVDEFLVLHGLADERHDAAHVRFLRAADVLVFVGMDHRADALAAEEFGEQRLVGVAVEQVDARHALAAGAGGGFELEAERTLPGRTARVVF